MATSSFRLMSEAFNEGEYIPRVHSREGEERSPALSWSNVPEGTQSLVLEVTDPDAPGGTFAHWVLYDIPPTREGIGEGEADVGVSGRNDTQGLGWGGPFPPPGHGDHRYYFKLAALDLENLGLPEGARREEVEQAMEGHVLDEAQLMGRYRRD